MGNKGARPNTGAQDPKLAIFSSSFVRGFGAGARVRAGSVHGSPRATSRCIRAGAADGTEATRAAAPPTPPRRHGRPSAWGLSLFSLLRIVSTRSTRHNTCRPMGCRRQARSVRKTSELSRLTAPILGCGAAAEHPLSPRASASLLLVSALRARHCRRLSLQRTQGSVWRRHQRCALAGRMNITERIAELNARIATLEDTTFEDASADTWWLLSNGIL